VIIPFAQRRLAAATALAAAILGTLVALHYHRLGLTLTHYDARGHLIVARRIFDSITPGWQQIGAVWLPLPHLLNAIPIQNDFLYRTGASAVAISIASFAVATAAIAWIVFAITESAFAAIAGAFVFALNPNVLYLQSTPMTEPLLIALCATAVAALLTHTRYPTSPRDPQNGSDRGAIACGLLFAFACLTRYEAWPVTVAALALAAVAGRRAKALRHIALYPFVAVVGFSIFSRVVVGEWFVSGDFFIPENKALGDWWLSIKEIAWGTTMLSSEALVWVAAIGLIATAAIALIDPGRRTALIVLALGATAAIPLAAFHRGHPFRIRYMIPLLAIEAIGCGLAAGVVRRASIAGAVIVATLAAATLRPLDANAPMVLEAQWDAPNLPARATVTACLRDWKPGQKIMASMGSLGHYMQEASTAGFQIRDFLHEGNGDIWLAALDDPSLYADWMLIEEKAEGGDMLAHLARERPKFLDGFVRVCDGAGLALYRRER
jgi:hypothetical protein